MNYLAHALGCLDDDPYVLAGTSVPDWLSVVDRKVRVPGRGAAALSDDEDPSARGVAMGVLRHLEDDRWFHETRDFAELSLRFAVELRDRLPGDEGFRPSFLGHILVEILIDATLIERDPSIARRYYAAIATVAPEKVQAAVNRMAHRPTEQLIRWINRFLELRFLYDYLDDDKLLFRLEQVMQRVGLPALGNRLDSWFPAARRVIADRCDALLTPPPPPTILFTSDTLLPESKS
jgi:hypothetical protein